jgi:large subunit ribosomal protein L5
MARLKERFNKEIAPEMKTRFNYSNIWQVPRLEKIIINMGLGEAAHDNKIIEEAVVELTMIAGQRAVVTKAKKAIANFKIRKGSAVGCKVTLRKDKMYEFIDRLICIVIPRIKDFRGLSAGSFDGGGNYAFGLTEQTVFPEIDADKVTMIKGMDIIIVTSARTDEEARELLTLLGMPFKKT